MSGRKERSERWYMVTPKAMVEADPRAFSTEEEEEEEEESLGISHFVFSEYISTQLHL